VTALIAQHSPTALDRMIRIGRYMINACILRANLGVAWELFQFTILTGPKPASNSNLKFPGHDVVILYSL
jgi:hypothetical protein